MSIEFPVTERRNERTDDEGSLHKVVEFAIEFISRLGGLFLFAFIVGIRSSFVALARSSTISRVGVVVVAIAREGSTGLFAVAVVGSVGIGV